ncbi:hypothetical protein BGZ99_003664 [Dissophora globulifera]|uniref:Uncharacterized protein n=1 Tax=Dissophora globulifera TaxID=979702 RepID=A0A9P6RXD3_9FUNG|nr:hypothetical protein BGZ99_003664 [Dissophora globulifera]
MNTSRPSSRPQYPMVTTAGTGAAAAPPQRTKVASIAQRDLSVISFPSRPVSLPGTSSATTSTTTTSAARLSSTIHSPSGNNGGSGSGGMSQSPRLASSSSSVRMRPSSTIAAAASLRSSGSVSGVHRAGSSGHSGGNGGQSSNSNGNDNGSSRRDTGSVTSDDGTISEDSDRAGDEMQLFSGGQAGVGGGINLPFGSSSRHSSLSSSSYGTGPKIGGVSGGNGGSLSRHRTSSSIGPSSANSSIVGSNPKPVRIAAGASIKIDSGTSHGSMSSSHSSQGISTPSGSTAGSLVGVSSPPPTLSTFFGPPAHLNMNGNSNGNGSVIRAGGPSRNGDDSSSTVSMNSALSAMTNGNQHQQATTVRPAAKVIGSGAAAAAAASKLAEENRRAEEAARTRRKIADLEISNASLLSINQTLEATIRKQASEVQELKMRMQSAYFGEAGYTTADLVLAQSVEAIELTEEERQDDLMFKRLCLTIEQMVYEAKHAMDQSTKPTGVKVLSLYEMYEKEVAEEAEAEEEKQEDIEHSFVQDGNDGQNDDEDLALDAIDQSDDCADDDNDDDHGYDDESEEGEDRNQDHDADEDSAVSLSHSKNSTISSAELETPLAIEA